MRKILPIILLATLMLSRQSSTVAASASLSLSPASGTQTLNSTFSVDVRLDTGADTIKTVKAYLTFPATLLSVEDIVTTGSIVTNWTERLYSNTNGTINLGGETGVNGISGAAKVMATIKFKVKSSGNAAIKFTSTSQVNKLSDESNVLSLVTSTNATFSLGGTTSQPTATPSGTKLPDTGNDLPTTLIVLLSFSLIALGILMGRRISPIS